MLSYSQDPIITVNRLKQKIPVSKDIQQSITKYRQQIAKIINKQDSRLLAVIGPCSIHDPAAALEYAHRLKKLANKVQDNIFIVMRVYFEKPRTTIGWQGLINDPNLDNSLDINKGLTLARELLCQINSIGMPTATEFLDPITAQYLHDFISWGAIGARTSESQIHRNLASGLDMPIGFKNNTTGDPKTAIDAIVAAKHASFYYGINTEGQLSLIKTSGNNSCHLILRGGYHTGPNYDKKFIQSCSELLKNNQLQPSIMIDCSHGNSTGRHQKQSDVAYAIREQLNSTDNNHSKNIIGLMLESNIHAGRQSLSNPSNLTYGVSITDNCIGWDETEDIVLTLHEHINKTSSNLNYNSAVVCNAMTGE